MGLTWIPEGRLEKSSKADTLTGLATRILICISGSLAVTNNSEKKKHFESISKEILQQSEQKPKRTGFYFKYHMNGWSWGALSSLVIEEKIKFKVCKGTNSGILGIQVSPGTSAAWQSIPWAVGEDSAENLSCEWGLHWGLPKQIHPSRTLLTSID